jgi:hypothetical protein
MIDGNIVIFFYDLFVICLFLFEMYITINRERLTAAYLSKKERGDGPKPVTQWMLKLLTFYDRKGILTVNTLLMGITLICIFASGNFDAFLIGRVVLFCVVFMAVMVFVKRIFVGLDRFENGMINRCINAIFYLIFGHCFVLFSGFVSSPQLFYTLAGLVAALLLCAVVMVNAIINPKVLFRHTRRERRQSDALGVLKGMGVLIACMLIILYMMVFSCWRTDPALYAASQAAPLDAWDMLYYLFSSFSTIGYGDIVPVRADGMFYSRFVGILIAVSSIFTTACFVGAVVAGAGAIRDSGEAQRTQDEGEGSDDIVG